jgi:hypothetical protein
VHTLSTFLSAVCTGGALTDNNAGIADFIGQSAARGTRQTSFSCLVVNLLTVPRNAPHPISRTPSAHRLTSRTTLACIASAVVIGSIASATNRLSVEQHGLEVRVDDDAPPVLDFQSDDILPIRWERQGLREARLPAIAISASREVTILDPSGIRLPLTLRDPLPRILVDPARYARETGEPPGSGQGVRGIGFGLLFSLGLMLVLLVPRYPLPAGVMYCLAWAGGLAIVLANRPALLRSVPDPALPVIRLEARQGAPLRVPIDPLAGPCIPIVESPAHLRALSIRVEVCGERAELVADLPPGARLYLTSMADAARRSHDPTRSP